MHRRNSRHASGERGAPEMTWGLGFFRIWVLFSVGWIAVTAPGNWHMLTGQWLLNAPIVESTRVPNPFDQFDPPGQQIWGPNIQAAQNIFGPPLLTLLAGLGVAWTLKGFKRKPK